MCLLSSKKLTPNFKISSPTGKTPQILLMVPIKFYQTYKELSFQSPQVSSTKSKARVSGVKRMIVPQRYLHPEPRTCEHVTLHSKRDFAAVIRTLNTPDYPGGPGVIPRVLKSGIGGRRGGSNRYGSGSRFQRTATLLTSKLEEGAWSPRKVAAGRSESKEMNRPLKA